MRDSVNHGRDLVIAKINSFGDSMIPRFGKARTMEDLEDGSASSGGPSRMAQVSWEEWQFKEALSGVAVFVGINS